MTDIVEATDAIYKDWLAYATGAGITAPVLFGNENEVDGVSPDEGEDPWYRVSYREAAGGRAGLSIRRYERVGFLAIQCFVPTGTGVRSALSMAEGARDFFEDSRSTTLPLTIVYRNGDVRPQPPDGKWYPVLLEVEVEVTDIK